LIYYNRQINNHQKQKRKDVQMEQIEEKRIVLKHRRKRKRNKFDKYIIE